MLDDLLIAYLHTCEDPVLYTSGRVLRFGGDVTLCGALFNAEHPSLQSVPSLALRDSALFSFFFFLFLPFFTPWHICQFHAASLIPTVLDILFHADGEGSAPTVPLAAVKI